MRRNSKTENRMRDLQNALCTEKEISHSLAMALQEQVARNEELITLIVLSKEEEGA